ncbi:MAG: TetR/AcrR family transcriptional regulator [Bdellovibrio sp.]|nr:TetR/AcrR family transcriptional regulator [Bdellovibrio sp.]
MGNSKNTTKKIRDLKKSRQEILDAAFWEVFTRGFQGVSVDDIVKKTTLTKGAFYHQFPTKMDLGYALVDEVIKPMTYRRWIDPLQKYENPLEGILLLIKNLIGKAKPQELRYGCPLNNLMQEMAPIDKGFKERLEASLLYWIDGMEQELKRAKKSGYVRDDVNIRQVAHFVVMTHEGFYGMLKALDDPKAFNALYDSLKRYFETLKP